MVNVEAKTNIKAKEDVAEEKNESLAKVCVRGLHVSTKSSILICDYIRGKKIADAKRKLERIFERKVPLPLHKYNSSAGHKPGIGPGRYPEKTIAVFLELLNSLEANASDKGLDATNLVITEAIANKGHKRWHYGRRRRIKMKNTSVKLTAVERETSEKK